MEDLKEDIHGATLRNQERKERIRRNIQQETMKDFEDFKKIVRGKEAHFDVAKSNEEFAKKHNPFNNGPFGEKTPDQLIEEAMKEE